MSKPSGGIRSLHSLSACGLPTPIVALACIGNVGIQAFSSVCGRLLFLRRLQDKPPLKRVTPHGVGRCPQGRGDRSVRGGSPLGGGRIRPRSATSSAVISKPSGGIARCPRCPPGACQRRLLPFPVLVMLIFRCFLVQAGNFISYGVCKFVFLGSPLGHPKGVPCAELSPQVTEGLPATAINRFHKELRFFFSLLKRKKEAKKEKSSHSTCIIRFKYHPKFPPTKIPRRGIQAACPP